jgi:hypothetical protein
MATASSPNNPRLLPSPSLNQHPQTISARHPQARRADAISKQSYGRPTRDAYAEVIPQVSLPELALDHEEWDTPRAGQVESLRMPEFVGPDRRRTPAGRRAVA